jgi:hypothetical protein
MLFYILVFAGGLISGIAALYLYHSKKKKRTITQNSIVLIERVKQVLKLVTVEGDFSEIVKYKDVKPILLDLYRAEKKALVTVSAKAMVGFDLAKAQINKNDRTRTIHITSFPEPEIISIDANIEYYHTSDNLLNKFVPEDHTEILKTTKESIREKIPESGLHAKAIAQANQLMAGLEHIAERLNWKLEYGTLKSLTEARGSKE